MSTTVDEKEQEKQRELLYKVLVVGDIGVGKTSIIKRYVHGIFSMHYKSTIGVDFALKVLNWDPYTTVRIQLWDIAGQERFGNMTRVYYKEAVGAMVVFDVTRVSTFEAVQKWKNDIDSKVTLPGSTPGSDPRPIPVVLLANKIDLAKDEFAQSREQMDKFCKEHGFVGWFETSAKDNLNIDKATQLLVKNILDRVTYTDDANSNKDDGLKLGYNDENNKNAEKSECRC